MEDKFNDNNLSDENQIDTTDCSVNEEYDYESDSFNNEEKELLSHSDDSEHNYVHEKMNPYVTADSHYLEDDENKAPETAFVNDKAKKIKWTKV